MGKYADKPAPMSFTFERAVRRPAFFFRNQTPVFGVFGVRLLLTLTGYSAWMDTRRNAARRYASNVAPSAAFATCRCRASRGIISRQGRQRLRQRRRRSGKSPRQETDGLTTSAAGTRKIINRRSASTSSNGLFLSASTPVTSLPTARQDISRKARTKPLPASAEWQSPLLKNPA